VVCPDATAGGGFLCDREAAAVREGVALFGHAVARITLDSGWMCPRNSFGSSACPMPTLPPGAARFLGSAVVEFVGTSQQAYLNLFASPNGTIIHEMRFSSR